jgi:glucose/arabinose dehydrogenase
LLINQFGTPEEIAARVVLAELRRDGIFDVTLMEDPEEDPISESYRLHYLSQGKRGNQHFVCQIHISPNQKLYVVTGQCPESSFPDQEIELKQAVHSFRVLK